MQFGEDIPACPATDLKAELAKHVIAVLDDLEIGTGFYTVILPGQIKPHNLTEGDASHCLTFSARTWQDENLSKPDENNLYHWLLNTFFNTDDYVQTCIDDVITLFSQHCDTRIELEPDSQSAAVLIHSFVAPVVDRLEESIGTVVTNQTRIDVSIPMKLENDTDEAGCLKLRFHVDYNPTEKNARVILLSGDLVKVPKSISQQLPLDKAIDRQCAATIAARANEVVTTFRAAVAEMKFFLREPASIKKGKQCMDSMA